MLALPPVVNAIMAQAAQQADTSWLRDADFDGQPEIDDIPFEHRPPPGAEPPPGSGETPPPPRDPPPQPVCEPFTEGRQRSLQDGISQPAGTLALALREGDRGVTATVRGNQVTGTPRFELQRDGERIWSYSRQTVGGTVDQAPDEEGMSGAAAPEEWTLTWDLRGVVYERFDLTLATFRCEVPRDG